MAESIVQVTQGSGLKLHSFNRTIGANSVEDEVVILGENYLATYIIQAQNISIATANDHILQIMAGASLNVRIRKIEISQAGLVTAASLGTFDCVRLTTAGTGGTAATAAKYDNSDAASGTTGMTLPTVKGTEGVVIYRDRFALRQTNPVSPGVSESATWVQSPNGKPIIIPAGATNGLAIKNITASAGATVDITIEFVEANF